MARYGYHVERVLAPDSVVGFPVEPNIVKVVYFDRASGMDCLHEDPAHERIERELYPPPLSASPSGWSAACIH
jgi:hypothetical protein